MATIEYHLYRLKLIRPRQPSLFGDDLTPRQVMDTCIDARLSGVIRKEVEWHIGNVERFEDGAGYFRVGKTRPDAVTVFDEESGDFFEEDAETSQYAHCVFDSATGVIAVARNYQLAPQTRTLANVVARLFRAADIVVENDISVEIDPIPNPEEFLNLIQTAYQVSRFAATFKGPNPFDADEYFQKPLSVYCQLANADNGQATVVGQDLDREVVSEVARSTAATGNKAKATIRRAVDGPSESISLTGNPVSMVFEEQDHSPEIAVKEMQEVYYRVRESEKRKE